MCPMQILKFVQDLHVSGLHVSGGGCLGGCGKGPNVVVIQHDVGSGGPPPEPIMVGHVATPNDAAEMLRLVCGVAVSEADVQSVQARLQGNVLAQEGELEAAIAKYTEGISKHPAHGLHLLYCNRSAALLELGRKEESLQDALRSLEGSPPDFSKSWLRVVDSYYALGQYSEAAAKTRQAVQECPGFKALPEFKDVCEALRRAGHPVKA